MSPRAKTSTFPQSLECEKGVLSSILVSNGAAISECEERGLSAGCFYVQAHRTIYTVLTDLWDAEKPIDQITVTQALQDQKLLDQVGGPQFVTELQTFVPTAANVGYYIDTVRAKYILRETSAAAEQAIRQSKEAQAEPLSVLSELESRIASIRSLHGRNGNLSGLPQIEDGAELIAKPIVLPDQVIENVLHRGAKMVVGGASKTFKTWTLVDAAVSVATGTDWLGKFPTKRGSVLYVNLELQNAFFTKRLATVCDERQLKIESGYLTVWNLRGHAADLSILLPRLLRGIGRDDYVLIILDPVYKLLGSRDENKAGDIASLLNEVESLAVKTGAAVAFGAHYSKGNQAGKDPLDRVGGSGVFARDPDSILNFTKHQEKDCFTVDAILRNHPPIEPFVVRWEFPLMCVDSLMNPDQLKQAGAAEKTYHAAELVELLTRPMSAADFREIAEDELGMSRATFFRLFAEAKTSGAITSSQGGKWKRK